jgi:hypothetical protein
VRGGGRRRLPRSPRERLQESDRQRTGAASASSVAKRLRALEATAKDLLHEATPVTVLDELEGVVEALRDFAKMVEARIAHIRAGGFVQYHEPGVEQVQAAIRQSTPPTEDQMGEAYATVEHRQQQRDDETGGAEIDRLARLLVLAGMPATTSNILLAKYRRTAVSERGDPGSRTAEAEMDRLVRLMFSAGMPAKVISAVLTKYYDFPANAISEKALNARAARRRREGLLRQPVNRRGARRKTTD